jgi:hypothetical protein
VGHVVWKWIESPSKPEQKPEQRRGTEGNGVLDGLAWVLGLLGNSIPPRGKERSLTLWRTGGPLPPSTSSTSSIAGIPTFANRGLGGKLIFAIWGRRERARIRKRFAPPYPSFPRTKILQPTSAPERPTVGLGGGFHLRYLGKRFTKVSAVRICVGAGDECPISVKLVAWRDSKGHVGLPRKLKHL